MFASRDQENLVHAHQTTAAGKPLNQPARGFQPKTPGNRVPKTPFRVAFNDENKPIGLNGQKSVLEGGARGNENILQTTKKAGKLDKNAFVTPVGPRTRAPLGAKTTNARGQAFQTPGLAPQTNKPDKSRKPSTIRKSIKSKITVAPSEPVEADLLGLKEDDDVPEVEYAPPPPIELPDPPEVFEYDENFPQFKGSNMCRGFGEIYFAEPTDEHGVSLSLREYEKKCAQYDREVERQIERSLDNPSDPEGELDKQVDAMIAVGPTFKTAKDSSIDTLRARSAADALSQSRLPSVATKPTASSLQKARGKPFSLGLNAQKTPEPTNPSPMRHKAAEAVSKTTIGFPRARHAPSILPQVFKRPLKCTEAAVPPPVKQSDIHPMQFRELYGDPPEGSDMWIRLREHERFTEDFGDDMAEDLSDTNFFPLEEDNGEIFQLPMPS